MKEASGIMEVIMKKVKTNKEELFGQFEFSSSEMTFYLDTQTGEIVTISEFDDLEEEEETKELIEDEPERFIAFPEQDSRRGYDDMVDFTNALTNRALQDKLAIALNGRGCFRRFKDVLFDYPEEREAWFAFEGKRQRDRFEEWLEDEEIEIVE